jgi:hypothetical protein
VAGATLGATEGVVVPPPAPVTGATVVAVVGGLVVAVVGGLVVAVVGGLVVAVGAAVVGVGGGDDEANVILADPVSLASSPKVRVHTSPMAACAAVGGHGYSAASAVGLLPAVSVAGHVTTAGAGPHGGPTVPSTTLNFVETAPLALTVTIACNDGALQLTEMLALTRPPSMTFGWFLSLLHSRIFPIELAVNPLPVIVTISPLVKPVPGVTVMGAVTPEAAPAETVLPRITSPEINRAADPMTPSVVPMRRSRR